MTDEATFPNFGGVGTMAAGDVSRAEVVFVQAPYEGSVTYGAGAAGGPAAILEASRQVETRDEETGVRLEELAYALGPVVLPATDVTLVTVSAIRATTVNSYPPAANDVFSPANGVIT